MTITYATTGFGFVDSQYGSAANATGLKTLVNQVVDKNYHRTVQKKIGFQKWGWIGPDTYQDGDVFGTAPGYAILRKTDLQGQKGDVIKMGLVHALSVSHISGGKVADAQLVDAESALDLSFCKVSIEEWRYGLRGNGGMNEQRFPYGSQADLFTSELEKASAENIDTSILYAAACGFAPHLFRVHGISNCVPTTPTNTLYGNDQTLDTTRTIADIVGAGTDNVKALTFEIGAAMAEQNDLDPLVIDGENLWGVLISAKAAMILMQDDRFRNAMLYAMERGKQNPLFRHVTYLYNNCMIYTYDKIRTILGGNNPASLTVSNNAITEVAYTGIGGGVTSSQLHQTLFFGANSVALAEGKFSTNLVRSESDYDHIIGRATSLIFGARRTRFTKEDTTTNTEQGLVKVVNTLII